MRIQSASSATVLSGLLRAMPIMRLLVFVGLGVSAARLLPTGMQDCPCIDGWNAQDDAALQPLFDSDSGCIEIANDFNGTYSGCVPFTPALRYGSSGCSAWDESLSYCGESACSEDLGWCSNQWCYVDIDNCQKHILASRSSYWPSLNLHYSYQTCGSLDSWTGLSEETLIADTAKTSITEFEVSIVVGEPRRLDDLGQRQRRVRMRRGVITLGVTPVLPLHV